MSTLSIADWAAAITVVVLLLSLSLGAAWWMSALFSRVRSICVRLDSMQRQLDAAIKDKGDEHARLWEAIRSLDRDILQIKLKMGLGPAGS